MYKTALPFLGVIALVLAVLFCGVSALAAWREHHGHAESGFVIVSHLRSHVLSERASAPACPKRTVGSVYGKRFLLMSPVSFTRRSRSPLG